MRAALLLVAFVRIAVADDDGAITGFEAKGSGPLSGRAVDADGKPLANVEIHVVSKSGGEQIVRADKDGKYTVTLKGAPTETSMIFVRGHKGAHIGGIVADSTIVDGAEAIEIKETSPPAVPAKPVNKWIPILPYSQTAAADNIWTRAWMTLDVDAQGHVQHLRWIQRPGHDLEAIAVNAAFALQFEPARDRAKRAISSQVVWVFEWPSYWWLEHQDEHTDNTRMPANYLEVECQKPGEKRRDRRDCSQADLKAALGEAWIARPKQK
ncbi:MAG: hypothetical protein QM831_31935 [Kofleriaceae bacterium]